MNQQLDLLNIFGGWLIIIFVDKCWIYANMIMFNSNDSYSFKNEINSVKCIIKLNVRILVKKWFFEKIEIKFTFVLYV